LAFILLISDFQDGSYKTGLLKRELHSKLKDIEIIDISHQIKLNNTIEAAFICKQIQFNDEHKNIILCKVGSHKETIVYQQLNNLYIFPNNGLLGMVIENLSNQDVYILPENKELEAIEQFLTGKLNTLDIAGSRLNINYNRSIVLQENLIVAECLYCDGNGNAYFNLTETQFVQMIKNKHFQIRIQHYTGHIFKTIGKSINDVGPGEALFSFSKNGYLKLQINLGNAQRLFRIKEDSKVIIETE
jgi:S-adenosylmethionine hydrolase